MVYKFIIISLFIFTFVEDFDDGSIKNYPSSSESWRGSLIKVMASIDGGQLSLEIPDPRRVQKCRVRVLLAL
jgi:hypothetical protein